MFYYPTPLHAVNKMVTAVSFTCTGWYNTIHSIIYVTNGNKIYISLKGDSTNSQEGSCHGNKGYYAYRFWVLLVVNQCTLWCGIQTLAPLKQRTTKTVTHWRKMSMWRKQKIIKLRKITHWSLRTHFEKMNNLNKLI